MPPRARREGLIGWAGALLIAIWGWAAKASILLKLVLGGAKATTFLSMLASFGLYALWGGPGFAAGLILMIFVHEMGHVIEIRRQGMQASAPIFIPFMGAAIFQRSHPTNALRQAEIGIAGPIAGTIAATVAFVLHAETHWEMLLLWAWIGFWINLINLIPAGFLDGGWILGAVSKWFQVAGLAAVVLGVFVFDFISPLMLVFVLLGLPVVFDRFRNDRSPYYQSVPVSARWAMGGLWLLLVLYLGFATLETTNLLAPIVR
jgi:Zn-dependent protease